MYEYELFLHYKQGDDFHALLEAHKDVVKALLAWAEAFEENAAHCKKLASELKGKEIEVEADVHFINFSGDEELLNQLAEKGLLQKTEIEDEEEWVLLAMIAGAGKARFTNSAATLRGAHFAAASSLPATAATKF